MQTINIHNPSVISLEQARTYIYSIDFYNVINKLINHCGWIKRDAAETCQLYRNFLYLNKKYEQQHGMLLPSVDVDEFWHNHILDTEAYERDCQAIFGRFFHHYPYLGIDEKSDESDVNKAFEKTQELHFREFNIYIFATKSRYPKMIYSMMRRIF